jgi:hypothetical protein
MSSFEISTLVHLLVAILIAGSVFIQWRAVHPAVTSEEGGDGVREKIRQRWAPFVHLGSLLMILTGLYQLMVHGLATADHQKTLDDAGMPYHMLFGIKFLLAMGALFIASAMVGRSEALAGIRRNGGTWLGLGVILIIAVVVISRLLAGLPEPL